MPKRDLQLLPVPTGANALEILPVLERALDGGGPALLPAPAGDPEQVRRISAALSASGRLEDDENSADDPTSLVIATSGSTGTPKGVLLTTTALRASAAATHDHLGGAGHWLLAMPAHHIAGVQVLIRALLAGTRPHAVDTSAGFRPDRFAEAAGKMLTNTGPHYTALVPTQLSRLLSDDGAGLRSLREFDAVLLGGAATTPATLRQAHDAGVRVVTTYGMSETSGGCVYDGTPLEGVRVHIDGESGPISLSGPTLARGYRHQPEAAAFHDGWFDTGDLGRWSGGKLEVLGRADDLIISGGVNVPPAPVERALTEQDGVREACVIGVDDPEWGQAVVAAVVPDDPSAPPPIDRLRAAVRERAGSGAVPKRIEFLAELPLRGPGKPDREALRDQLAN